MIPAATDPRVQERAERYKAFTLPALYRCSEQADEDLTALYRAFARLDLAMDDIILSLPTLLSPTECEAVFLDIPLAATGFDRSMAWVRALPESAKRRLLMAAAEVWAAKGTGWRDLLNAIVGGRAWLGEWAALRDVVGGVSGEMLALPEADAGTTLAHYTNPDAVDDDTVEQACDVVRPVCQALLRDDVPFLDDFAHGLAQWMVVGVATIVERGRLRLASGRVTPILSLDDPYQLHVRLEIIEAGVLIRTYLQGGGEGYEMDIEPQTGDRTALLTLVDSAGGALGSAMVAWFPAYTYSVRIAHFAENDKTRVQVRWEGSLAIDALADSGYTPGAFSVTAIGTADVRLIEALDETEADRVRRHGRRR